MIKIIGLVLKKIMPEPRGEKRSFYLYIIEILNKE